MVIAVHVYDILVLHAGRGPTLIDSKLDISTKKHRTTPVKCLNFLSATATELVGICLNAVVMYTTHVT